MAAEQDTVPGVPVNRVEPTQLDSQTDTLSIDPDGWAAVQASRRNSEQHALVGNVQEVSGSDSEGGKRMETEEGGKDRKGEKAAVPSVHIGDGDEEA
eukprot:3657877-Alexandrium_andersonii.AAC.1